MTFNPNQAADATRAQSLAISFADNTAKKSLKEIGADPANRGAILAFQTAAGIAADGKVGTNTLEAYNYYLGTPFTPFTASPSQIQAQKTGALKPAPVDTVTVKIVTTSPTATPTVKVPIKGADIKQGLFSTASLPALPILLALSLLGLGAGIAVYRVSR